MDPMRGEDLLYEKDLPHEKDLPREESLPWLLASDLYRYFPALYEIYQGRVLSVSLKLAGNREDAEDIVQDTFSNAFIALASLSAEKVEKIRLLPWLRRIARNSFFSMLRKRKIEPVSSDTSDMSSVIESLEDTLFAQPETALENSEFRQKLYEYLKSLPPKYRIPVILRYVLQLSYPEIADALNVSVKTAKGLVSFGLKKLRHMPLDQVEVNTFGEQRVGIGRGAQALSQIPESLVQVDPPIMRPLAMTNSDHFRAQLHIDKQPTIEEEHTETSLELAAQIDKLPATYQRTLDLKLVQHCSDREIARLLDLPLGTVKSHISRGRELLQEIQDETEQTITKMENTEASIELETQINKLPATYQRTLDLKLVQHCSDREIAKLLDLPLGTVKSHVSRGKELLRERGVQV